VEEMWLNQRKNGGTKPHHDRISLDGVYAVDGGGGGAIFIVIIIIDAVLLILLYSFIHSPIHSFSILSDDRFKTSSKTIPPHSAI
jgi:hypothetical protein